MTHIRTLFDQCVTVVRLVLESILGRRAQYWKQRGWMVDVFHYFMKSGSHWTNAYHSGCSSSVQLQVD